jgi:hypothetical protein
MISFSGAPCSDTESSVPHPSALHITTAKINISIPFLLIIGLILPFDLKQHTYIVSFIGRNRSPLNPILKNAINPSIFYVFFRHIQQAV